MSDDKQFSVIISETISHIGVSNYSSGKIFNYLTNKGYDSGLSSDVVSELVSRGYIDDRKASRSVLLLRTGKKRESRLLSLQRLINAGISEVIAESVVSELPEDCELIKELFDSSLPPDFDNSDETMHIKALKLAKQRGFTLEVAQKELKNR